MDYTAHGILQARILEWVVFPFSRGSSQPRDGTQVSHIAGEFFTSWATGKHMNTGVGSLSLLHIPTQELNWGLLHCRWILYKLSYQRSPCLSRYLVDTDYSTANFLEMTITKNSQDNLKSKLVWLTQPDIKPLYKATVNRAKCHRSTRKNTRRDRVQSRPTHVNTDVINTIVTSRAMGRKQV